MDKSYRILLAGNPNVGKSTVFNALTGLKQHTGNWTGKTVDLASGSFEHKGASFHIQDLPGTYSLISNSPEEEIARDAISSEETDLILVVADATCLARNLNLLLQILEINTNAVLCINLLDEATRKKITLDFQTLEENLHIPVIGISAHKHKDILNLKEFLYTSVQTPRHRTTHPPVLYPTSVENAIQAVAEVIPEDIDSVRRRFLALKTLDNESAAKKITSSLSSDELARIQETAASTKEHLEQCGIPAITFRDILVETLVNRGIEIADACVQSNKKDTPHIFLADKILTSRRWGIPIILVFLAFLLWITISGANIPSALLMEFFLLVKPAFAALLSFFSCPEWLLSLLTEGIYQTTTWVTSVMLPPMLIFFPLFTMLEDLGVLPRLAFNLDSCFKKSGSCGKQALTMCKEKFKMLLQHNQ